MPFSTSPLLTKDGLTLFTREWLPTGSPLGVIALVHGMGEHSERYNRVAEPLARSGYVIMSFDLRGHGRSEGQRGHTPSYEHLLDDIEELLHRTEVRFPGLPLFLYGHSLGGNLVLNFALRRSRPLNGVIATSPWLRLAFEPPKVKLKLSALMNRLWPSFSQNSELDASQLTRDETIVKAYENDPLVHGLISARLFQTAYTSGMWALENAAHFPCPLLLMHGSADQITSWKASEEFAQGVPHRCTFKLWDGFYHELHHEPESNDVFNVIQGWLKLHMKQSSSNLYFV